MLSGGETEFDRAAKNHFERAAFYDPKFEPLQALPHYERAYAFRSNNPDYGEAYADPLSRVRDFVKAGSVHKKNLGIGRDLARANPRACLPDVASTLNNLEGLYGDA